MMYQVSRKTFMSIGAIICGVEKDYMEKAEEICELIEVEVNHVTVSIKN